MQRLCGSDAFAIYSETPTSPFVTLKVAIYRPARAGDAPDREELRRFVRAGVAMHGGKCIGMRIVRVPFDLHHPVWLADPGFSIDDHIYNVALPPPGGKAQLCDFISDLMGMPLNPDRPLWEIWIIEGLEEGCIAIVSRLHHALADGKTVAARIAETHGPDVDVPHAPVPVAGESLPGSARLLGDALVDLARSLVIDLPRHLGRQRLRRHDGASDGRRAGPGAAKAFTAPLTVLDGSGGRYRVYRYETFSLSRFRALARAFGCTLNTLILTVCAEALRRYLLALDRLPASSLVTAMPIGESAPEESGEQPQGAIHNNHLAAVAIVPLYTQIADFAERLEAIRLASREAIDVARASRGSRFEDLLDFVPGKAVKLMFGLMDLRRERLQRAYANVVISNVPGPREIQRALGGRLEMVELLSAGNLMDAGSLNITVWSYADNLSFSFYSRKGVLPRPDRLNELLREAVDELRDL